MKELLFIFSLLFPFLCVILPLAHGALAQLVARDIRIVEVRGSTPLCSTNLRALIFKALSYFFVILDLEILHIFAFSTTFNPLRINAHSVCVRCTFWVKILAISSDNSTFFSS